MDLVRNGKSLGLQTDGLGQLSSGLCGPTGTFVKFFLVASWYMHLRTDQPVFRRFFIVGSVAAVGLYALVLLMLHVSF